ncbi:MAG TPA: hypothetical protein VF224_10275, partial [Aestuariivirga sp.]
RLISFNWIEASLPSFRRKPESRSGRKLPPDSGLRRNDDCFFGFNVEEQRQWPRKKPRVDDSVILFDVIYEDGTKSSRRKVAASELADSDGDDHARTLIMAQDREIAKKSGNQRGTVKSISRSPT